MSARERGRSHAGDGAPPRDASRADGSPRGRAGRDFSHVLFISAGAGSGKTYRLTEELEHALVRDRVAPARVIGTTFTVKAAAELRERVRQRLIERGFIALAEQTAQALIGTVHSVSERLLRRFAFELGLSPELSVASIEDCAGFFNQALDETLAPDPAAARRMNAVAWRLGIDDWRGDVKTIADRARENAVSPDALAAMGRRSADDMLAHFPKPEDRDWDGALFTAVQTALDEIDLDVDTTNGTRGYYEWLKGAIYGLRRPPVPWSLWITASKSSARAKSDHIAARVREAAAAYDRHPQLHADLREYVEQSYSIAARALARFQEIKTERGLIDFGDMEQRLLAALDEPHVRERLAGELDLLLVDEFQDTNPMQLAIFMKLAALAGKAIFVGDVKQAIYGFRGCDPELVHDTLAALVERGGQVDVLERSWRSRPALVEYVNHVFVHAFAGELERRQVELRPQRTERTDAPAVLRWTTTAGNRAGRAVQLAGAIARLVASGFPIVDPDTDETRPVRWGDVAVLAASNDSVEEIAKALRAAQVPMKMTLSGLLTVPEIAIAKAALRRLADPADTIATAEIVSMTSGLPAEAWLEDRLRRLENGGDGESWAADHPIVARLEALRPSIGTQSPVEIVARVLNTIGLREAATGFSQNAIKAAQRHKNLDALLDLAVEYERHCDAQHLAATLTGFLFWLENPHSPELDLQPVVTSGDAVHVLTYHKAKGLEWPVVVAADLHFTWPTRLWDVRIERDGTPFDVERPLAGRLIRYWPNVFGKHSTGMPVLDALCESAEARACNAQSERENRRLAYVGLTRARDALVLAVPGRDAKQDAWIRTFHCAELLPAGDRLDLGGGKTIPTRAEVLDDDAEGAEPRPFAPRRLPERAPADAPREGVYPSGLPPLERAHVAERIDLGARIPLRGDDMTTIGTALHGAIAAHLVNPGRADALERVRQLLAAAGVDPFVDAEHVLAAAERFRAVVAERFAPRRVLVEYPIVHRLADGRVVRGSIDVLLETARGLVVIDHKSSPRPKSAWTDDALEHSGQLDAYRRALEAAGRPVAECWIHFPVSGGLLRVTGEAERPAADFASATQPDLFA
ncbi:MAG TPA: UvrD-helicase domain-containing protein [Gammaproteobacteria bacterium]